MGSNLIPHDLVYPGERTVQSVQYSTYIRMSGWRVAVAGQRVDNNEDYHVMHNPTAHSWAKDSLPCNNR